LNSPLINYYKYIIDFTHISVVILYSFDIIIYVAPMWHLPDGPK